MKHNESLLENPYLFKPSTGTTDKTSANTFNNKLPANILKKVRKEARKSDSNKNANNVVYILRDPVIKSVNGGNVSDYTNVKVRSRLGGTTEDLIDYVKAIAWTKPKMLVIHTGTNDLLNDMNTIKKVKKVIQSIGKIDIQQKIQIAFSGIINWEDNNFAGKIEERKTKLGRYCKSKGFIFINNSKLDSSSPKGVDCI